MARMRKKLGAVLLARLPSPDPHRLRWRWRRRSRRRRSEGGAIDTSNAPARSSYWLWDSNQQPAYQSLRRRVQAG